MNDLFDALHSPNPYRHLTSFLEIYCVIHKARPATIVPILSDKLQTIRALLSVHGVSVVQYRRTSTNYMILNNCMMYTHREKIKQLHTSVELDSETHVLTGHVLGYMTPFDIFHPPEGEQKDVDLKVYVEWNTKTYEIQLAPQRVVNVSDETIDIYYGRMKKVLQTVGNHDLPFCILYSAIKNTKRGL